MRRFIIYHLPLIIVLAVVVAGCAHSELIMVQDGVSVKSDLRDEHRIEVEFYEDGTVKRVEVERTEATSGGVISTVVPAVLGFVGGILSGG